MLTIMISVDIDLGEKKKEPKQNTVDRIKKRRKGVEKREKGAKAIVGIHVLPQGLPENPLLAGGRG